MVADSRVCPVTVSSRYRIPIPRALRERLGLKPGQKVVLIPWGNTLRPVMVSPIEQAQGMFAGIDTELMREDEAREYAPADGR